MPGTALTCESSAASTLLNLPEPRDAGRCYIFTGEYLFLVLFRSQTLSLSPLEIFFVFKTPQKINSSIGNRIDSASSPSPVSCYTLEETLPQEALNEMVANLMKFLLLKCQAKELTSQVEMLKKVLRDNQEHFPVVFSQGSECLQLDCGIEVKEVDPSMVPTLGITCYAMLSSGQGLPKASLAVLVLSLIMWNGDHTPEEVWGALSRMGVCVESEHCVFGEPRTLLTHVWVQQGYMEYQQVLYSHPACYEFLWGTRAYAENSKWQVMAFLLRFKCKALRAFPMQSVEAAREEYEAAWARAPARLILPSVIEEGAVSLLRSDGPSQLGKLVYNIFGFLFSTMTWRFITVLLRKNFKLSLFPQKAK